MDMIWVSVIGGGVTGDTAVITVTWILGRKIGLLPGGGAMSVPLVPKSSRRTSRS